MGTRGNAGEREKEKTGTGEQVVSRPFFYCSLSMLYVLVGSLSSGLQVRGVISGSEKWDYSLRTALLLQHVLNVMYCLLGVLSAVVVVL